MQSGRAWYILAESAPGIIAEMNRHERRVAAKQAAGPTAHGPSPKAEPTAELYARGQGHLADGRHAEALDCYLQVLKLTPKSWDAAFRCAVLLYELKQHKDALAYLDRCEDMQPHHAMTVYMRARALRELKNYPDANTASQEAEALAPIDADVFNNAGIILQLLGRDGEAIEKFDHAIELRPGFVEAISNRSGSLTQVHKFDEAFTGYALAKSLAPDDSNIDWNVSLLHLLTGNFEAGWAGRESRWTKRAAPVPYPVFPSPMWMGQGTVDGKTILIYADEGLGDAIQFARYLPLLAAHGARIILVVDDKLHSLLARLPGVALCLPKSAGNVPRFDFHCALSSLPLAFGTRIDTIPASRSYLPDVSEADRQVWESRLGPHDRLRIGLVWSGNPLHVNDHNRSVPLHVMTRLVTHDALFVSLQRDPRPADAAILRERGDIVDLTGDLPDFSATAALIACLDIVITVDTSVAHLSAAQGRPTWILVPYTPDYRWMLDRDDSPWYPTVRLFRQDEGRDYQSVVDRISIALAEQVLAFAA
jgi:tetratricopeptide (TPR) repeat protein